MNKWLSPPSCFECGHFDMEHRDVLKDGGPAKCTHDGCQCQAMSKDYAKYFELLKRKSS